MIQIEPIPETRTKTRNPYSLGTPWARRRVLRAINESIEKLEHPYRWLPESLKAEYLAHEAKTIKWASNRLLRDYNGRISTDENNQPLTMQTVRTKHADHRVAEKKYLVHGLIKEMYASGQIGIAITMTLPGRYHFNQHRGRKPSIFDIWALYHILNQRFRTAYQQLKKLCGVRLDYIIAPEPHEDGTPHIHWVLFVPTEHLNAAIRILKRCLIDRTEPYADRQAEITIIRDAPACCSYATKTIGYLAKFADERAQNYREWRQWNGIKSMRFGGILKICDYRETRRLGETPRQAPDIDYDPAEYADPDDPEETELPEYYKYEPTPEERESLATAMNELAAKSHGDDYWQWLQAAKKYGMHRITMLPHCIILKVPNGPENPKPHTLHVVAIVPGGWARIRRMPQGWRPAILAKITCIDDEDAELAEAVQNTMRQLVLNSQDALRKARQKARDGPPPATQSRLFE